MNLEILGNQLELINPNPALMGWIEERWIFPQHQGVRSPIGSIQLEFLSQAPAFPETAGTVFESLGCMLESRLWESEVWLAPPGDFEQGGATYNLEKRHIRYWGKLEYSLYAALFLAVSENLAHSGLLPLHCSIAAREGQAVAFLGPSGQGKTSTLRRALAAGWDLVAEDFAWLDLETWQIFGWDKGVRVLPHDLPLWQKVFPQLQPSPLVFGKHAYSYEELGFEVQPARLVRLALLERNPDLPTEWGSLSARDAVMVLWQATGVPLAPQLQAQFALWSGQVARGLQTSRLVLGRGEPFDLEVELR